MTGGLSAREAAAVARVTPTALHNARRAGRLPARRVAGLWVYDAAAVAAYAAEVAAKRARAEQRRQTRQDAESERSHGER